MVWLVKLVHFVGCFGRIHIRTLAGQLDELNGPEMARHFVLSAGAVVVKWSGYSWRRTGFLLAWKSVPLGLALVLTS